ncbi:MAG TPA: FkbM family methyltransferase [Chthoniobacterales bacterium]|jgi:FkbM family methyltransferase|nr:FkbM family methyltransferase [Chthoniobacterales bacterium]
MSNDLVYDIGMNNGDDTAYYLYRGFRVLAVEADPVLVEKARVRFAREIGEGRLIIKNAGIAEQEGELPFWICEMHSEWSSFHRSIASRENSGHYSIDVPCIRFRSLIQEHGIPYYLKIDIEGNDHLCLRDLTPGTAPIHVSVEASDIGLLDQLRDLGYGRFQCISQFHYLPLERPPSLRQLEFEERTRANQSLSPLRELKGWRFNHGSSGPFGPELPGRWQNFEEMKETFSHFQALMRGGVATPFWNDRGYSFWADFHATQSAPV